MNKIQTAHLKYILSTTNKLLGEKYVKGTIEHKSNLGEDYSAKELLEMAIEEAIDQIVYLLTLRQKL